MSRSNRWNWQTPRLGTKRRNARQATRRLRVELLEDRRLLAVFSVDNLNDSGTGSLRDAIFQANANGVPDEITFSVTGTIDIASQLPTITEELIITGHGQDLLTIDAGDGTDNTFATGDGYRILHIDDGDSNNAIDVTLNGLTLTGGDTANGIDDDFSPTDAEGGGAIFSDENLTVIDSTVTGNATGSGGSNLSYGYGRNGGEGGGIYSSAGILLVTNSTISGNTTGAGGDSKGTFYGQYGSYPANGASGGHGGGIRSRGSLIIASSVVSGNTTGTGGNSEYGNEGNGGSGGGIYARNSLTLTNSTLSGNSTTGDYASGGGLLVFDGSAALTSIILSGNRTTGDRANGGAISSGHSDVTITDSTLSGNGTAGDRAVGGAISASSGTLTLTSSTLSGNSTIGSRGSGGGIYTRSAAVTLNNSTLSGNSTSGGGFADGGAISSWHGAVTLNNSTLSGNSAEGNGGGISSWFGGDVTLNNSTLSGNSTMRDGGGINVRNTTSNASLTIENSIVANNTVTAGDTGPDFLSDPDAALTIEFSIIGDNTDTSLAEAQIPDANGNLIGSSAGTGIIDPLLGLLADNGGSIETHALLAGSPAINAGDMSATAGVGDAPLFDQRGNGFGRVSDGRIDMGAFEVQVASSTSPGDFNADGIVNAADYTVWRDNDGAATEATLNNNGDGLNGVDSADYDVWVNNFGATYPPAAQAFFVVADDIVQPPLALEPSATDEGFAQFFAPAVASSPTAGRLLTLVDQNLPFVSDNDLLLLAWSAIESEIEGDSKDFHSSTEEGKIEESIKSLALAFSEI